MPRPYNSPVRDPVAHATVTDLAGRPAWEAGRSGRADLGGIVPRCSGVISSQRAIMRWRQCMPPRPCRKPPNRSLARIISPIACQKVMSRSPNSAGIRTFHRPMATKPPMASAAATKTVILKRSKCP